MSDTTTDDQSNVEMTDLVQRAVSIFGDPKVRKLSEDILDLMMQKADDPIQAMAAVAEAGRFMADVGGQTFDEIAGDNTPVSYAVQRKALSAALIKAEREAIGPAKVNGFASAYVSFTIASAEAFLTMANKRRSEEI